MKSIASIDQPSIGAYNYTYFERIAVLISYLLLP